jgi:hypothetical protein
MTTKKSSRKRTTGGTEKRPAKRKKIVSLAEYEADRTATGTSAPRAGEVGAGAKKSAKAGQAAKERKASALSAAAQVLAEADGPLSAGEIVKRMLEKGLWQTKGRTPAATLYSALLRRIRRDGAASGFRKVGRGLFELVK